MEFDGDLDIKARELEDRKKTPDQLTQQAAMRWADEQLDPLLPKPPFFLHIVGGIGKGKTTIILNMLKAYQKNNTFCKVYYYSPSGKSDPKLRMFLTSHNDSFEYTPENLDKTFGEIAEDNRKHSSSLKADGSTGPTPGSAAQNLTPQELKSRFEKKIPTRFKDNLNKAKLPQKTKDDLATDARKKVSCRNLIIFDDATGSLITGRNTKYTKDLVSIRHDNTSIIMCTHSDTSLAHQVRNIVTTQILFEPGNDQELKNIAMDIGGIDVKQLGGILNHVRKVPHGFLLVDKRVPFQDRFVLNLKERLNPDAFIVPGSKQGRAADHNKDGIPDAPVELFRSNGYLPSSAPASKFEARYAAKGKALQQEAIRLNQGLLPAEKIMAQVQEKKRAKRLLSEQQAGALPRTEKLATLSRANKRARTDQEFKLPTMDRAVLFKQRGQEKVTELSRQDRTQSKGAALNSGVLEAKFQKGVARNTAIATGGRRGFGGRGRRSAAAVGPMAQQLEEMIKMQQELKNAKDANLNDEKDRKAESDRAAEAELNNYEPNTVGPFRSDEYQLNQVGRDNPPQLPDFPLSRPGMTDIRFARDAPQNPLRGQLVERIDQLKRQKEEFRTVRDAELNKGTRDVLMQDLAQNLPTRPEDRMADESGSVVENEPQTQAEGASIAQLVDMNTQDTQNEVRPVTPEPPPEDMNVQKLPPVVDMTPSFDQAVEEQPVEQQRRKRRPKRNIMDPLPNAGTNFHVGIPPPPQQAPQQAPQQVEEQVPQQTPEAKKTGGRARRDPLAAQGGLPGKRSHGPSATPLDKDGVLNETQALKVEPVAKFKMPVDESAALTPIMPYIPSNPLQVDSTVPAPEVPLNGSSFKITPIQPAKAPEQPKINKVLEPNRRDIKKAPRKNVSLPKNEDGGVAATGVFTAAPVEAPPPVKVVEQGQEPDAFNQGTIPVKRSGKISKSQNRAKVKARKAEESAQRQAKGTGRMNMDQQELTKAQSDVSAQNLAKATAEPVPLSRPKKRPLELERPAEQPFVKRALNEPTPDVPLSSNTRAMTDE